MIKNILTKLAFINEFFISYYLSCYNYGEQHLIIMANKKPKIDLVDVDDLMLNNAIDAYFLWSKLDNRIRGLSTRGINLPSEITEIIAGWSLNISLNKGSAGDLYDKETKKIIEVKGTSVLEGEKDLTSFSPSEYFDELVFLRLRRDDDIFEIYKLDFGSEDLKKISVNKTQKVADQQNQKRRPRFSVMDKLIIKNGIKPVALFDCKTKTLTK